MAFSGKAVQVNEVAKSNTSTIFTVEISEGKPGLWKIVGAPQEGFCGVILTGQSTLDVYIAFTMDVGVDGGLHSNDAILYPVADGIRFSQNCFTCLLKVDF